MSQNELKVYLKSLGASLVGFADLQDIDTSSYNNMGYGIAFAIKISPKIIKDIHNGPTETYYEAYNQINKQLDHIAISCVKYINHKGHNAIGQTSTYVTSDDNLTTPLPHKTVATRAGLGWIGKNALLITTEYGSAIRISSVITDMPLIKGSPINESKCGKCDKCAVNCPAEAIKGMLWNVNSKRSELLDPFKCRQKARELLNEKIGIKIALCGKCIEVCPFTKQYIIASGE
ncbi:4Fe-4S double cluster binding domain-containing protein [Clostridium akagii]|uniref:4Fe-4S double cluster binding domain-containing protein n=1 Tax=Clostridium akagii TaxID=91623 RepID=UPI000478D9BC|nr:4Fe-4S double cluster binding domain-containing protein [Clostridium akagii]